MRLTEEIQSGLVGHLDLEGYVATDRSTPVRQVLALMRQTDRTTALVTEDGRLTGIFTERDVLKKVVSRPDAWDRPVGEFMTPNPQVVGPDVNLVGALRRMRDGHFRDLPVTGADGRILGNLTDNEVVRHLADRLQAEVINLPPDPNQVPRTVEGA